MKINFIFRSKDLNMNSIENVFNIVTNELKTDYEISSIYVPEYRITVKNLLKNLKYVKKYRSDLNHVTGDIHYILLGLPKKKTILTVHDLVGLQHLKNKYVNLFIYKLLWAVIPSLKCKYITTVSEKSRKEFLSICPWAKRKIYVIPNPVNNSIIYSNNEFNKKNPRILLIGTTKNKNHERIIEAVKDISCTLDIIGKIPEEEIKILEQYKIKYENSFSLTDEEIAQKYKNCDIVLFPSTYEGFGMPIIEAQTAGRVVITSSISPMNEVASNGACLVNPYNVNSIIEGILKVINDDEYRKELIEKGRKNADQYSAQKIAAEYKKLYEMVKYNK